jgi:4-amino-4-deoxy-L-arabinose transferase-like glycosyltransferase
MMQLFSRSGLRLRGRAAFGAGFLILLVGACLAFAALGDRALWDDEAQTAVLGRQVLKHGLPLMLPEENVPTDRADRADFNDRQVFIWNTWLPHYLVAASFGILGESELAARLPFAVTGVLTLLLIALVGRMMYPTRPWYPLLASALLALSIPFLLHVRQSRYYALAIFGTLWMVYGYLDRKDGRRPDWKHMAAGGAVCFHSFHVIAAINGLAFLLHALWRGHREAAKEVFKAGAAILLVAAPAIIYMRLWSFPPSAGQSVSAVDSFWVYLLWLNGFLLPLPIVLLYGGLGRVKGAWLWGAAYALFLAGAVASSPPLTRALAVAILLLALAAIWHARPSDGVSGQSADGKSGAARADPIGPGELLAFFSVTYVLVLSLISQYPFYRYVVPLTPLAALFMARVVWRVMDRSVAASAVLVIVLVASNLAGTLPLAAVERLTERSGEVRHQYTVLPREIWRWTAIRSDLASYLDELRGTVADPERCVADAVAALEGSERIVKASYGDLSLMYYAPDKRIISRHAVGDGIPDVVVPRDPYALRQDAAFLERVRSVHYAAVKLPCPNIIWSNNPDPLFHRYRLPEDAPPLVIYRRQHD